MLTTKEYYFLTPNRSGLLNFYGGKVMKIRRKEDEDLRELNWLLSEAITEDISTWYRQWQGGDELGFAAKSDIYNIVIERLKKGVEI